MDHSLIKPDTKYAKSGQINIAYQIFGHGPVDLVYIPGWVSNIDLMWECPELAYFFKQLSNVVRLILFDKRGTGLSDRMVELSTIEERMDDIRAVMDAAQSERAILFGHSEGGSVSALFAATYPNRTIALISFGIFAKRRYCKDYPWAPTDAERQKVYDMIEHSWGSGEMDLASLAPSKAKDHVFISWLAKYFRSGASPSAALVLTKMNTQVDIIGILDAIQVPTLLMQRTNDIDVKIEEGYFIAERIKNSKFVELDGDDHLFWAGDVDEVIQEMVSFIEEVKDPVSINTKLMTVVSAEIYSDLSKSEISMFIERNIDAINDQLIKKYKGALYQLNDSKGIAVFEGPGKAIHCCLDFIGVARALNLKFCAGIHLTNCVVMGNEVIEINGLQTVNTIRDHARENEIVVSHIVKNLLSGSGLNFTNTKVHTNFKPPILLSVVMNKLDNQKAPTELAMDHVKTQGAFIDHVLQCISDNISDEQFSVEMLSREVGMSERQLQRKLKATTNKTPNQLIKSVRLHKAKELLLNDRLGIGEIAFKVGFANPSYFTQCFKQEFGIIPSEFPSIKS